MPTVVAKVVTASEMIEIENRWFASGDITLEELMERVGRAIADWILQDLNDLTDGAHVLILVGKGNNGGDALVAARHLLNEDINCTIALVLQRDADDPLLKPIVDVGGTIIDLHNGENVDALSDICSKSNLILDGVFGFNISRAIQEPISTIFSIIRESGVRIIAIDMPSGAHPDTGVFDTNGLPADVSLAVGLHKLGLASRFGDGCYGTEMIALDVGMPAHLTSHINREVNDASLARSILPQRTRTAHKGDFGRALLIAGSRQYVGAAALATRACVRSGVGLVALATSTSAYQALAGHIPEATYLPLPEDSEGIEAETAYEALHDNLLNVDSVLVGTGLGLSTGAHKLVSMLLSERELWAGRTAVFDADGLTIVSRIDAWWEVFEGDLIITPHPGEMSRLLGVSIADVEKDRVGAVETAARKFNCIAILKGATTFIASPSGRLRINMMPNDGLARGGSGDVLAGLVTGLAAKMRPFDAASLAVHLHSQSAGMARDELTSYAMTAADVITYLPRAFRALASYA